MTPPTESVAKQVRRRRSVLGLSQGELADRAGVHRDTVGNVELGKSRTPQGGKLRAVLAALDEAEADRGIAPAHETLTTAAPPNVIRVIVQGLDGPSLTIEAPPENLSELEALVDRVMANMAPRHAQSD